MSTNVKISYEKISDVLSAAFTEFKKNPHTEPLFVFPTEIEKNSWVEWAVLNTTESGVEAVNTEQFIAWDEFKSKYIQPVDINKNCIPPLIRKVFAQRILKECKFKKIIASEKINDDSIFAFTDWLAGILPSLALWEKHYENDFRKNVDNGKTKDDEENKELLAIYEKYIGLLGNDFFEPSYADINFSSHGRKIFIFYPTILQDFSEYIETLQSSSDVTFVILPSEEKSSANTSAQSADGETSSITDYTSYCVNYPDARKELRRLALQIRKLMSDDVDLRRVAINVPDLENIRPYIEREFRLYEIPFVIRNGIPYTKNCGGDIFIKIKDCIDSNFSLDAMRNILMDGFLPWRDAEMNLRLVQAGVKQRIVCSSTADNDIWLTSFEGKSEYKNEKEYYEKLKNVILKFANAKSFRDLKIAWHDFSKKFINEAEYQNEVYDLTNKILGRIITELQEFADVEEDFNQKYPDKKITLNNYLDFFVNEIERKSYTPNEKKYGVNILSYRIAACADFGYQFIINANQDDITVPLKSLSFITNEDKRKFFGLTHDDKNDSEIKFSEDGSAEFVRLYNAQYRETEKKVFWSSAKVNFNGAAITHTALREISDSLGSLDENDFVKNPSPKSFAEWQMKSFEKWEKRNVSSDVNKISESLKAKIRKIIKYNDDYITISASALNSFYPCPKRWLFQNVMGIDDEKYSAKLAEANEIGNLYHKVLELYFGALKGKTLQQDSKDKVNKDVERYLEEAIKEEKKKKDEDNKKSDLFKSKLSENVLKEQYPIIVDTITRFIMQICKKANIKDGENLNGNYGGYIVEDTEKWLEFVDSENKIIFNGKIDLTLSDGESFEDADGVKRSNAVIIDYKTGSMPDAGKSTKREETGKIENFQMAMYVKLLENAEYTKDENNELCKVSNHYKVQNGLFYSIKDTGEDFGYKYVINNKTDYRTNEVVRELSKLTKNNLESAQKSNKDPSEKTFDPTLTLFTEYAKYFRERILNVLSDTGDLEPNLNTYKALTYVNPYSDNDCKKCRFKSSCRTTFNIGKADQNREVLGE